MIISLSVIYIVRYYPVFVEVDGYGYGGFKGFFVAISLMTLFYFLPFNQLPKKVLSIINGLTRFTMGVYGMHMLIGRLLNIIFTKFDIAIGSLKGCVFIYILCYFVSFVLSRMPSRTIQQLVE